MQIIGPAIGFAIAIAGLVLLIGLEIAERRQTSGRTRRRWAVIAAMLAALFAFMAFYVMGGALVATVLFGIAVLLLGLFIFGNVGHLRQHTQHPLDPMGGRSK